MFAVHLSLSYSPVHGRHNFPGLVECQHRQSTERLRQEKEKEVSANMWSAIFGVGKTKRLKWLLKEKYPQIVNKSIFFGPGNSQEFFLFQDFFTNLPLPQNFFERREVASKEVVLKIIFLYS